MKLMNRNNWEIVIDTDGKPSGYPLSFIGLSTDTKPTTGVPKGSRFTEIDTSTIYHFNGSSWVKFNHQVTQSGSIDAQLEGTLAESLATIEKQNKVIAKIDSIYDWIDGTDTTSAPNFTQSGSIVSTVETIINSQSVAAGGDTGLIDLGITDESEIWLSVNVDKQPWSIAASTLTAPSPSGGIGRMLYPDGKDNTTTY